MRKLLLTPPAMVFAASATNAAERSKDKAMNHSPYSSYRDGSNLFRQACIPYASRFCAARSTRARQIDKITPQLEAPQKRGPYEVLASGAVRRRADFSRFRRRLFPTQGRSMGEAHPATGKIRS